MKNNLSKVEKMLKSCFKEKFRVTAATMVAFLITGTSALGGTNDYLQNVINSELVLTEDLKNNPGQFKGIVNVWNGKLTISEGVTVSQTGLLNTFWSAINISKDATVENFGAIRSQAGIAVSLGGSQDTAKSTGSILINHNAIEGLKGGVFIYETKGKMSKLLNKSNGKISASDKSGTAVWLKEINSEKYLLENEGVIIGSNGSNAVTIGGNPIANVIIDGVSLEEFLTANYNDSDKLDDLKNVIVNTGTIAKEKEDYTTALHYNNNLQKNEIYFIAEKPSTEKNYLDKNKLRFRLDDHDFDNHVTSLSLLLTQEQIDRAIETSGTKVDKDGRHYIENGNTRIYLALAPLAEETPEEEIEAIKHNSPYILGTKMSRDSMMAWNEGIKSLKVMPESGQWLVNGLYTGNYDNNDGNVGHDSNTTGVMATAEYGVAKDASLGLAFGAGKQRGEMKDSSSDLESDTYYMGAFGKKNIENYRFLAGMGYQKNRFDGNRDLENGTSFSKSFDTDGFSAMAEARYVADLGNGMSIEPKLGVDYIHISQDDINEGTAAHGMKLKKEKFDTVQTEIGADLVKEFNSKAKAYVGASYAYVAGDTDKSFTGITAETGSFKIQGPDLGNNIGKISAGAEVENAFGIRTSIGASYSVGKDSKDLKATFGLGYKF